jgi:hypothetical protein
MAERVYHYVRRNEAARIPRAHIFLDTEASESYTKHGRSQTWRLAVTRMVSNHAGKPAVDETTTYKHADPLWRDVDRFATRRSRTVVWAHNLGYDLRIADALRYLPELGWRLDRHNLANRGSWLTWRNGDRTLILTDSASIWPQPLAVIGKWFGLGKLDLPDMGDGIAEWERRCERDVQILSTAVLTYLEWLEAADLGNWRFTGSGQSDAAFRHRFLSHRLLVHADMDALTAERRAMWTGRCEAYWYGSLLQETIEEWDMQAAYPRIAAQVNVPTRLKGELPPGADIRRLLDRDDVAILADVDVTTTCPAAPASHEDRILWPVGRFRSVLWSPELRLLVGSGQGVRVNRGWIYRAEPALQEWARWILGGLGAPDSDVPAWQKAVMKHHGRALIGHFAMTYQSWDKLGQLPGLDVWRGTCHDMRTGVDSELMRIGSDMFQSAGRAEWDQSLPQITGYIQSECRARMWHIMQALGEGIALYVDTDSVLVRQHHHDAAATVAALFPDYGLRLKRSFAGITVLGPRQVVLGHEVRISGIPHGAQRFSATQFTGQQWESLEKALRAGNFSRVDIRDAAWQVTGTDHRRRRGAGSWTTPVHIGQTGEGEA